jgi:glycosyltransferase involved in cell wall biosynthesis
MDVVLARPGRRRRDPAADVALYHVGNDPEAHGWIVEALRRRPGVVVLHELVLHHLVIGLTLARGDSSAYLTAMEREAGLVGRLLAHASIDHRVSPVWDTRPQDFPLAGEVLEHATATIVHSQYVEDGVRRLGYDGPIRRIPHPAWPTPSVEPARVDGSPVFGCFGHLNESKRVPQLLEAFERVRARRPNASLLLVGAATGAVDSLPLPEGVMREQYVDEARLWSLMAACDVHVSLRWPTMGETSGSVVRALSLGKPLVVSDVGWFAELPDDVAAKIAPDENEVDSLAAALADEPGSGQPAKALAEGEHAVERVAEAYAATLEEAAGGAVVRERVLREVATAAGEVGIDDVTTIGARMREVGLGE